MAPFLDLGSTSGRTCMTFMIMLTMINLGMLTQTMVFNIGYLSALDIYSSVCKVFIASTMAEFCILNGWITKNNNALSDEQKIKKQLLEAEKSRKTRIMYPGSKIPDFSQTTRDFGNVQIPSVSQMMRKKVASFYSVSRSSASKYQPTRNRLLKNLSCDEHFMSRHIRLRALNIDRSFQKGYFASFFLFNFAYWVIITKFDVDCRTKPESEE